VSQAILCVQCLQRQTGQPYYSNVVATPAAFGVMLQTGQPPTAVLALHIGETTDEVKRRTMQRQTGQPPTATLFMGIGETTDDVKRRVIRELEERLKELEPKLSRLSDEEIVRVIREGREGCRSGDP